MFVDFVRRAFFWDAVRVLALPLMAACVWLGARYWEPALRTRGLIVSGLVFGALTVLEAYGQFPFLYDYVQYLRQGDAYVREGECRIVDAASGTAVGIGMAMVDLYCDDGAKFVTKYRRDYQRVAWRWARSRQVVRIRYLPRSRLVLEAVPLEP